MKFLALVLLIACGSNHSTTPPTDSGAQPDGTSSGSDVDLADFPAAVAKAFCTVSIRCCGSGSAETQAQCEAEYLMTQHSTYDELDASVAGGRATYNPGPATACLAAITNLSCPDLNGYLNGRAVAALNVCANEVVGNVASGGTCTSFWDCGPTAACVDDGDEGDPMTCIPDGQVGDTCDGDCAGGLYCDDGTGLCAMRKPDGSACVQGAECVGNACNANVCGTNTTCNGM